MLRQNPTCQYIRFDSPSCGIVGFFLELDRQPQYFGELIAGHDLIFGLAGLDQALQHRVDRGLVQI